MILNGANSLVRHDELPRKEWILNGIGLYLSGSYMYTQYVVQGGKQTDRPED